MKEVGRYESSIERLQEFLKAICSQSEDSSSEAVESTAREETILTGETPAERLLMEKSDSYDICTSPVRN